MINRIITALFYLLLSESRAICRYISEKYAEQGNKFLLGKDVLERVSIEQWLKTEESRFDPPSKILIFHLAFRVDKPLMEQNERKLAKVLDVYEQRLSESRYLAGNEFSLADLSHLPNSHFLAKSKKWGYLFKSRKNVRKWWERISERPSWIGVVDDLMDVEELVDGKRKPTTTFIISSFQKENPQTKSQTIILQPEVAQEAKIVEIIEPSTTTPPPTKSPKIQLGMQTQKQAPQPKPIHQPSAQEPPKQQPLIDSADLKRGKKVSPSKSTKPIDTGSGKPCTIKFIFHQIDLRLLILIHEFKYREIQSSLNHQ